jgi:hypothetical protein
MSAVRVLATARDVDPSAFQLSEAQLVEAARIHSMHDLQRVAAYWRQAVEREHAAEGEEKTRERRKLHASVSLLGMVRVDGDLDPETGETLLTALGAVLDAESRARTADDVRTPAQRRADALGEICRMGRSWRTEGRLSRVPVRVRYPTEPSIWSSTRRFSSTAYSMGNSRVIGSMKPFTIMAVASTSVSPRLIR